MTDGLKIGEYYRLKNHPNYSWVKIIEILNTKPKSVKCEHTIFKDDEFGFIRTFKLMEIKK